VPAAEQLHDVEPEHEVPHAAEPEPSLPGLAVEQHVTAEPAPSIGDEDILEPVYVTPASAPAAPPSAMGEAPIDSAAQHAPAQSPAASPARARTVRRVLFAAGAAILIAACVVLGLHLGIFRSKPAVPAAPAAPAAAQQEMTAEQQSPPGAETLYVVKEGDTLWDIAARFTGDAHNYRGIAAHNGITNPDLISPGQVIRLPR
jgi:5'-nucleotidase